AVKGEPSENLTFGRSLNVHTLPSTVQDSASEGTGLALLSVRTRGSNRVSDSCVLGVREWNCGSIELGSERRAMVRSRACAMPAAPRKQAAIADSSMVLRMSFIVCCPLCNLIKRVSQTLRNAAIRRQKTTLHAKETWSECSDLGRFT